jgi:hypothetical protein
LLASRSYKHINVIACASAKHKQCKSLCNRLAGIVQGLLLASCWKDKNKIQVPGVEVPLCNVGSVSCRLLSTSWGLGVSDVFASLPLLPLPLLLGPWLELALLQGGYAREW